MQPTSLAIKEPLTEMLGVFLWTKFLNQRGNIMNRIHELKRQRAKEVERIIWEKLMDNHPELFSKLQEDALETWELYNEEEAVEIYEDDAEFIFVGTASEFVTYWDEMGEEE